MNKSMEETTTHAVGAIIWVKITGGKWWPAEVVSQDACPEEVTRGLRKQPLAIVKFFHEDYYEIVKSSNHLLPFVCSRKSEFIRKGRDLLKQDPDNKDKFNKDVAEAEVICGVPPEDIYDFCSSFGDNGPPSPYSSSHYSFSFGKSKQTTYGSAMVSSGGNGGNPSKPSAGRRLVQSYGGEGDTAYQRSTTDNGGSDGGDVTITPGTNDVRIRMQPSPAVTPKWAAYSCDVCGFQTGRIANIIVHGRSHSDALRHWVRSGCGVRDRPTCNSDTTGAKHTKKDANHAVKMQKLKRKLVTDGNRGEPEPKQLQRKVSSDEGGVVDMGNASSDAPSTPKKRGPKPLLNDDGSPVHKKRGPKPALNEDGTPIQKKRGPKPALNEDGTPIHKKRGPKPALNEDGTPVTKKRKKKEDDADSIFDKIKRQKVRKNSRGRPRGGGASFLGIGGIGHRRRAGSDGSSDEDEFLISRGVYEKEEEEEVVEEVAAPADGADEADKEATKVDDAVGEMPPVADGVSESEKLANEVVATKTPSENEAQQPMDISEMEGEVGGESSTTSEEPTKPQEPSDIVSGEQGPSIIKLVPKELIEVEREAAPDAGDVQVSDEVEVVAKEKGAPAGSPRAAHGRDYGSTSKSRDSEDLTSQQPEDLTSQPEDLTPQREEGMAFGPDDHIPSDAGSLSDDDNDEDDDNAPKAAPKSRDDSSSPPEDLTTRAEDLTSRPVDLSTLQEEPSSGALPEDASTLLEVSTSLLEDSATLLQSSATLLQDSASLLGGGPSSSSSGGGLLLPDSTGNSEDWPSRSSTSKTTAKSWPTRSEDWDTGDDACEESPSPRPDSHVTPRHRADEVSTSDVLRHLGLVPVAESAQSRGGGSPEETMSSAPHYGRDTPSSSDALLLPTVGTTDRRGSPAARRQSSQDPEESSVEQGAADDGVRGGNDADRVSQTNDDEQVSQTDDDRVSQTDDERVTHAEDDRLSHADDRISQSDDGNSHYEDDRISQTDYRISQTSYDSSRLDYQPARPYGGETSSQHDSTARHEHDVSRPSYSSPQPDHLVSQTEKGRHISMSDIAPSPHQPELSSECQVPAQKGSALTSSTIESLGSSAPQPMSSFNSYELGSEDVQEEEVTVPDVCAEEELPARSGIAFDEHDQIEAITVDSSVAVEDEVTVGQSEEVEESLPLVEDEVTIGQSLVEEELIIDHEVVEDEVTISQSVVEDEVTIPHEVVEDEVTIPHEVVEEDVSISHEVVEEEVSIPHSVVEEEVSIPHSEVEEVTIPHSVVEEELIVDQSVVEEEVTIGHSEVEEEVMVDQSLLEEECVSQVVECSTALEDCVIVDAENAAHHIVPPTEPHEHWSQHVIDENGMVVAAPPDIYEEDTSLSTTGQGYEGYVYGLHSIPGEEPTHHGHIVGDMGPCEEEVVVSSRRTDGDALSAAMESADVPIAMESDYSIGEVTNASMAGHVGLASSNELLASIPMPPSQTGDHYLQESHYQQEHYQPPLPSNDEYPPLPTPSDTSGAYDSMEVEVGGEAEEVTQLEYTKLETLVQQPTEEDGSVYMDDDVGMMGGAEEVVQVENTEEVIDEMDMFCNEVVIESDDRGQPEDYDAICMVQEETVSAATTEQSYVGVADSAVTTMGSADVSSSKGVGGGASPSEEEVNVNGALSVQGGVGLDNGLSFGHAR